eukprot:1703792-Rhodomonas_salina.3
MDFEDVLSHVQVRRVLEAERDLVHCTLLLVEQLHRVEYGRALTARTTGAHALPRWPVHLATRSALVYPPFPHRVVLAYRPALCAQEEGLVRVVHDEAQQVHGKHRPAVVAGCALEGRVGHAKPELLMLHVLVVQAARDTHVQFARVDAAPVAVPEALAYGPPLLLGYVDGQRGEGDDLL